MGKRKINVQGTEITLLVQNQDDFICITDIAKKFNAVPADIIKAWMRNRNTVEFLGTWELLHNPSFKMVGFDHFRMQTGLGNFILTVKDWVEKTDAVGMMAKAGRYGGTYAHRDIAFEFCSYVSPVFKLYFIKEFQRLKEDEAKRLNSDWNLKRQLAKANFHIHSEVAEFIIVKLLDKVIQFRYVFE